MLIDSHAHLTVPKVVDQVEEILGRAQQKNVKAIVNICIDPASLEKGIHLAERHHWIFNAAATTPHDVEKEGELFFLKWRKKPMKESWLPLVKRD